MTPWPEMTNDEGKKGAEAVAATAAEARAKAVAAPVGTLTADPADDVIALAQERDRLLARVAEIDVVLDRVASAMAAARPHAVRRGRGAPFKGGGVKSMPGGKFRYAFRFKGQDFWGPVVSGFDEAEAGRRAAVAAVTNAAPAPAVQDSAAAAASVDVLPSAVSADVARVAPRVPVPPPFVLEQKHLDLVRKIAMGMKAPRHIDKEDLVGWGMVGLMESLKRFNPETGVRFSTFAFNRIRGAMVDGLRSGGGDFSRADIVALRKDENNRVRLTSMDAAINVAAKKIDADAVADAHKIRDAMAILPERTRRMMEARFFEDKNLDEIGAEVGISKFQACRVISDALEQLRPLFTEAADAN